jgi:hypothetical protein
MLTQAEIQEVKRRRDSVARRASEYDEIIAAAAIASERHLSKGDLDHELLYRMQRRGPTHDFVCRTCHEEISVSAMEAAARGV